MEYIIERGRYSGVRLEVGRIPRRQIDAFIAALPQPEPPEKLASDMGIDVWGDPDAAIIDRNDPDYIAALIEWRVLFGDRMSDFVSQAVTMPDDVKERAARELCELAAVGLRPDNRTAAPLRYVVASDADMANLIGLVLYQSTVTARGMKEAEQEFGVMVDGKPLRITLKSGRVKANGAFVDRISARWARYTWEQFCELSGPDQSRVVAAHILENQICRRAA